MYKGSAGQKIGFAVCRDMYRGFSSQCTGVRRAEDRGSAEQRTWSQWVQWVSRAEYERSAGECTIVSRAEDKGKGVNRPNDNGQPGGKQELSQ